MQLPVLGLSSVCALQCFLFQVLKISFIVTQTRTTSHEHCVRHRTRAAVVGSVSNTSLWRSDTQAKFTWAQNWESWPPFWATNRIQFVSPKTGVLTPLSWHYCAESRLCLLKEVSCTAEGLRITWAKPGGMGGSHLSHPPHTLLPPAGNWPCEQQGSHGLLLLQESKLARSGTRENIHLTYRWWVGISGEAAGQTEVSQVH